jgi:heat shock protein HslJ
MNKALVTLSVFLISYFGFSQTDLIGEWYLESFTINGATYRNVYNFISTIEFTEDHTGLNDLEYHDSSTCNFYFGGYSVISGTINFNDLGMSAVDCSEYVSDAFENIYFTTLSDNFVFPSTFDYVIESSGNTQSLKLIKSNGDNIIYSKTNPEDVLHMTWYLQSISENGITYNISSTDSPNLTFGTNVHPFFGSIPFSGLGDCNDFAGEYGMYFGNGDEIAIFNFTPTVNICDPVSNFENAYFSILGDTEANKFSFEIINDGENLVLTNVSDVMDRSANTVVNNDVLIFSREALSLNEFSLDIKEITIIDNPVKDKLDLKLVDNLLNQEDLNYTIYNIAGQLLLSSNLNKKTINVDFLSSGIYFIRFKSNYGESVLKFVKK